MLSRGEVHWSVGREDAENGAVGPNGRCCVAHRKQQLVRLTGATPDRTDGGVDDHLRSYSTIALRETNSTGKSRSNDGP